MGQLDDYNALKNRISAAMQNAPSGSVLALKNLLVQADSLLRSDKGRPPGQDDPARRQAFAQLTAQLQVVTEAVRAATASTSASQGAQPETVKDLKNYTLAAAYRASNPFSMQDVSALVSALAQPIDVPDSPRQSFDAIYQTSRGD
jgi:hypothetical protein